MQRSCSGRHREQSLDSSLRPVGLGQKKKRPTKREPAIDRSETFERRNICYLAGPPIISVVSKRQMRSQFRVGVLFLLLLASACRRGLYGHGGPWGLRVIAVLMQTAACLGVGRAGNGDFGDIVFPRMRHNKGTGIQISLACKRVRRSAYPNLPPARAASLGIPRWKTSDIDSFLKSCRCWPAQGFLYPNIRTPLTTLREISAGNLRRGFDMSWVSISAGKYALRTQNPGFVGYTV